MTYSKMDLKELNQGLRAKKFSALELCRHYLEEIKNNDRQINAYITVTEDEALAQAAAFDLNFSAKQDLPFLAGIPCALKDNICTKGVLTSAGSKMLANFTSPYDAFAWSELKKQGAVLLGKTNLDEFALGSTTESSFFGPTRNPLDLSRSAGGSSGGSAAAVAGGMAAYALGSDTGGSVRQPAAYCNLVGMRPTYGLVSRLGLIALAASMDQIGPITRTIEDNALVLNAISGSDPEDSTSAKREKTDYTADLGKEVKGLKIGLPLKYLEEKIRSELKEAILQVAQKLEGAGAKIELIDPDLDLALPSYYLLSSAEASSSFGRFDGIHYGYRSKDFETLEDIYCNSRKEGFGQEVKRRIMLGTLALSQNYYEDLYIRAQKQRTFVKNELQRTLAQVDLILAPVSKDIPPLLGQAISPTERYEASFFNLPAALAGLPALSLPSGSVVDGMPVGLQLIGSPFSEAMLYRVGQASLTFDSSKEKN